MKAILLVAGASKRFWPLQEKPLFPLLGTTLFQKQLACLREAGFNNIIVVCSEANKADLNALDDQVEYRVQPADKSGMWGAALAGLSDLQEEPVLLVGNDNCTKDVLQNVTKLLKGGKGVLVAKAVKDYFPGGYIQVDNNRIVGIQEKPGKGNEPSNLVNMVIHGHPSAKKLYETLLKKNNEQDDGYEQALDELFKESEYTAVLYEQDWQTIKYPWHLLTALENELPLLEEYIHPTASIHSSAVVSGPVYIEEGVKIMPGACIVGPCYLGKNTIIGNNALIRSSSVGQNCVIGFGSEVKTCVLGNNVWTHTTYLGDSVIGNNVSFGAGSVTGNLRLDEQEISSVVQAEKIATGRTKLGAIIGNNCRLGIHTSLAPGIKIGEGTFISSAVSVETDIPSNSFVRQKNGEVIIKENTSICPGCNERNQYKKSF